MEINIHGMKTYITGIAMMMYGIGGFVAGKIDPQAAIEVIFVALGLMGIRHGVETKLRSIVEEMYEDRMVDAKEKVTT